MNNCFSKAPPDVHEHLPHSAGHFVFIWLHSQNENQQGVITPGSGPADSSSLMSDLDGICYFLEIVLEYVFFVFVDV